MPITTVQDANSIRGMSRCTRYTFYVTCVNDLSPMVCSTIKVMGHGGELGMCGDLSKNQSFDFCRGYNAPSLFQNLQ
jgi:hypothetical protein